MDVAVSGATGLIGRALRASLEADGHRVAAFVRPGGSGRGIAWDPIAGTIDRGGLEGLDAVVHLAGEGVAAHRWSDDHRRAVWQSRTKGTTLLAEALAELRRPPSVLVSGSAIGYYGSRGNEVLAESAPPGHDFLAGVCIAWEEATSAAVAAGIRTVRIRTGMVLSSEGGALGPQRPAFRLGLGAKAGRGAQWMSWIHVDDEIAAIRHAIEHPEVVGPVNLVAPQPVTNAEFTKAFARSLHRPAFLTIPRLVTSVPFGIGALAESLLFVSQRVEPAALLGSGYEFLHVDLDEALASL